MICIYTRQNYCTVRTYIEHRVIETLNCTVQFEDERKCDTNALVHEGNKATHIFVNQVFLQNPISRDIFLSSWRHRGTQMPYLWFKIFCKYFFYESRFGCKSQLSPYIEAVHKRKKPHICPICESSFSQKSNMKTHIASAHEMYESRFSAKSNLRNHIEVVHEGKKSHICSICESSFSTKPYLKRHILSVHEDKNSNKCSICKIKVFW